MCATGSPYRVGLKGMVLMAGEGAGMVTQQVWSPHKRKKGGIKCQPEKK